MASDRSKATKRAKITIIRRTPDDQRRREIGIRMRQLREARGLAQPDVAEGVGVTRAAVSQWERGQVDVHIDRLYKVADFLRCDPVWLHRGEGDPPIDIYEAPQFERANRRRAAAFVNAGSWSKKISQPPFFAAIPLVGVTGDAAGYAAKEEATDWFRLPGTSPNWQVEHLRIMRVGSGDLSPLIRRGDFVVIDTSIKVPTISDQVFAINVGIATILKPIITLNYDRMTDQIVGLKDGVGKSATVHKVQLKKLKIVGRVVQLISGL